jgi:hypothetical protein
VGAVVGKKAKHFLEEVGRGHTGNAVCVTPCSLCINVYMFCRTSSESNHLSSLSFVLKAKRDKKKKNPTVISFMFLDELCA